MGAVAPAVLALWPARHPGPMLMVTALAVILGVSVGLDAPRLALPVGAVFAGQPRSSMKSEWDASPLPASSVPSSGSTAC